MESTSFNISFFRKRPSSDVYLQVSKDLVNNDRDPIEELKKGSYQPEVTQVYWNKLSPEKRKSLASLINDLKLGLQADANEGNGSGSHNKGNEESTTGSLIRTEPSKPDLEPSTSGAPSGAPSVVSDDFTTKDSTDNPTF
jgi:hypothetical protein